MYIKNKLLIDVLNTQEGKHKLLAKKIIDKNKMSKQLKAVSL